MLEKLRRVAIFSILALAGLRLLALLLVLLLGFPVAAFAQQRRATRQPARAAAPQKEVARPDRVAVPDLVSGQKIVEAAMDYNTFKLGLAPGAVVLVEFPARDSILRVHPGDQNLVTVDDTDTAPNYPLIFRPGDGFVLSKKGPQPFALITVQMASGIPFVFQVYPVANIEDSASRVVIRYDRDRVVAARRAAGLPVNYKPVPLRPGVYAPEETVEQAATVALPAETPAPTPLPAAQPTPAPTQTPLLAPVPAVQPAPMPAVIKTDAVPAFSVTPTPSPVPARAETLRNLPVSGAARVLPAVARPAADARPVVTGTLGGPLRDYMKEVVADAKAFSKYSKPLYGISVAVSRPKDLNLDTRFIVIAVKNTLAESVRLVPGQPDLFVETLDEKRNPVLVEPIQKLGLETTAPNGDLLAPGATAYYAVAFAPPILGTHQYLRISVAQTTAADAPSSVDLTIKSR